MTRVVALDFDGVILESVAVKDHAIFDLFEDVSVGERHRVLDLHRKTPGINRRDRITLLLTEALGRLASPDVVDRLAARFASLVWTGLMQCPEVPGVRRFLEETENGISCYVVSAAPRDELRAVADQRDFSRYFIDILGTPPAKATLLQQVAQRENVPPDAVLFIGDKTSDLEAARTVGTRFIGRRTPAHQTIFPGDVGVIDDFETGGAYIRNAWGR